MIIRKASNKDAEILIKQVELLVKHVSDTTGDVYLSNLEEATSNHLSQWIHRVIDSETEVIFVAEDNSELAGFVMGKITKPFVAESKIKKIGYIDMCWVNPDYGRKEVGRKLISEIENWFKKKELRYIELNYIVGNSEAEHFWKKNDYIPYRISSRKELK